MSGVYSTRFLELVGDGPLSASYTVPSGNVAVIRDVTCLASTTSGSYSGVTIGPSGAYVLYLPESAGGFTQPHWTGRLVVLEGESIDAIITTGAFSSFVVSGYLLTA